MPNAIRSFAPGLTLAVVLLLAPGCDELPQPPFDASGSHMGTWVSAETKASCPFTLSLTHKAAFIYPFNHQVIGTAEFSYGCLLDNALLEQIRDELPELKLPVFGSLDDDGSGRMKLGVDTSLLDFPFSIDLQFDGTGEDTDADGRMDSYAGDFALTFSITTTVEGHEQVDYASEGTFTAARAAD